MAIIYNPTSGKRRDIRPIIIQHLEAASIRFEIIESKKEFDTFAIPHEFDIDKYSVLVAVGGDGTFHEVVNGMLKRKDRKKLPVGFLPNGSANDTNISFGVTNLDMALDYLTKGESIKMDIQKCLVDYKSEFEIPDDKQMSNYRY